MFTISHLYLFSLQRTMKSQALWRMYGLGYLASWRWLIVICTVPTILSLVMYLSLLSKLPGKVTSAKTFEFATELPAKLKDYSSASNTRWMIISPDTADNRIIGSKIAAKLNFGEEVDYSNNNTTVYNSILSANMKEFNQSFLNLANELEKIYEGQNGTADMKNKLNDYIQRVMPGYNASQIDGYMFFLDLSNVNNGIINYTLYYDVKAFQKYHRDNIDKYCMKFAGYSDQQYFSCYGYTIQHAIEQALYEQATNTTIQDLKLGQLPFEESGRVKLYVQASFQVMCVQPFIQIFLIFIINKYRQNTFTILKRIGVSTFAFWFVGFVFSFVLCYIALIIFYGFTMVMNQLPFVAYNPGVMFVYALLVALNYSATGLLFTVLFYDRNLQIIGVVVISLLVTQFPVLLTQMGYVMRGIWDDGTFPQAITHICCILLPQLAAHGLIEYLVQILPGTLLMQTKYTKGLEKYGFGYLGRKWQDVDFQVSISNDTYRMPPIWYFYILIPAQALVIFIITVVIGNVKPERKQSGLPFFYYFNKKYYQRKNLEEQEHQMQDPSEESHDSDNSFSKKSKKSNNDNENHQNGSISSILPVYTDVSEAGTHIEVVNGEKVWNAAESQDNLPQNRPIMLQVSGLHKNYRRNKVLKDFSMTVHEGEVVGLVGASGAGKSTFLNILADYVKPGKAETLRFYNLDLTNPYDRIQSRPYIAICPQDKENIFDDFTIAQNVILARMFSQKDFFEQEVVDDLIQVLGLTAAVNKTFRQLSGGMQRRFGLLMTLLQRPKLLVLDEVSANVDPILKRNIWGALERYREVSGCAIILASHDPTEVLEMADRVVFLENGVTAASGSAATLYKGSGRFNIIVPLDSAKKVRKILKAHGAAVFGTKPLKTLSRISTDFQSMTQLIGALQQLADEKIKYTISSVQVNDLLSDRQWTQAGSETEGESATEPAETQSADESVESAGAERHAAPDSKPRYLYLRYAALSTWLKALRSCFVVLLCSVAIIFLFCILEFFLIKSYFSNDKPISQELYLRDFDLSVSAFRSACEAKTDVFDCIVGLQTGTFGASNITNLSSLQQGTQPIPALIPPVYKYTKTIQRFFDIMGFVSLNNSIMTFGDGSMFLNTQDDNYRVFIIDKDSNVTTPEYVTQNLTLLPQLMSLQLGYSSIIPKLNNTQFNQFYSHNDTSKYFTRRFKVGTQNITSAQNFLVARNKDELFNRYYQAQELLNESRMSPQQIKELQNDMFSGIIDFDDNIIYTNIPAYPVLFKYSGLIKAVNNTENNQIEFVLGSYYSHMVLPAGANSANQIDADQPMLFNYNNDLFTRYYSAMLKKHYEKLNPSMQLQDLHDKYKIIGNFITQPFIVQNQAIRTTFQGELMRGEVTFRLFIGFTLCLLTLWHIYGFNKTLDRQSVSFIDGVGGNVSRMLASQIFIDFLVFTAKMYLTMILYLLINSAPIMSHWMIWVVPPLMALQMISVSYVACIILRNFSVITFYCGINFVFQTIINSIIMPNPYISLALGLFLPGFYYSSLLRSVGEYDDPSGILLIWGVLLSFIEIVITLLMYHFLLNKNKKKLSKEEFADENQILNAQDIVAWYKKGHPILSDFNLKLYKGKTASLVSSNGAGKSTFIKCVTGFSVSFSGAISMNAKIGIVPQDDACHLGLTAYENVLIMSCFGGNSKETNNILRQTGLDSFAKVKTANLGGGERRRLTIAMVLITRPTLLITDEVTVGLDSNMKEKVWDAILGLGECSVLNVTHDMHEIEALANECFILKAGRVVTSDTTANVMDGASAGYSLKLFGKPAELINHTTSALEILQRLKNEGYQLGEFVLEECAMESAFIDALADVYQKKTAQIDEIEDECQQVSMDKQMPNVDVQETIPTVSE